MDTSFADTVDHDPSFGISDGKCFVGFFQPDRTNYNSPCQQIDGESSAGLLQNDNRVNGPLVASRTYSSETKIQIRPTERWGSCHTEHDEGYTIELLIINVF